MSFFTDEYEPGKESEANAEEFVNFQFAGRGMDEEDEKPVTFDEREELMSQARTHRKPTVNSKGPNKEMAALRALLSKQEKRLNELEQTVLDTVSTGAFSRGFSIDNFDMKLHLTSKIRLEVLANELTKILSLHEEARWNGKFCPCGKEINNRHLEGIGLDKMVNRGEHIAKHLLNHLEKSNVELFGVASILHELFTPSTDPRVQVAKFSYLAGMLFELVDEEKRSLD
eukprot:TRINITY_DN386_c0_g1_i1.p1 TRINITY_DN386_c0_g1~~TRINITY_DN386_c0_g1_i1.p1  ORF type:complete len:228 (+),score=29.04 TRINITY_DN386_c0_g1_i1:558-1241(+)